MSSPIFDDLAELFSSVGIGIPGAPAPTADPDADE